MKKTLSDLKKEIFIIIESIDIIAGKYTSKRPLKDDLILEVKNNGQKRIFTKGIKTVNQLNFLIDECNVKLILNLKEKEKIQLNYINSIEEACNKKDIRMPKFEAMTVKDEEEFYDIESCSPKIIKDRWHGIKVAGYREDKNEKLGDRKAISYLLNITDSSRNYHYVLTNDIGEIESARIEGWQAYLIGKENLDSIFEEIFQLIMVKNIYHSNQNMDNNNFVNGQDFKVIPQSKIGGSSVSIQLFENIHDGKRWICKVGGLKGLGGIDENDKKIPPNSIEEYKEVLATKLYEFFGVRTPLICLGELDVSENCRLIYEESFESGCYKRLHIMSQIVEGFNSAGEKFIDDYIIHAKNGERNEYYHINGKPLIGFGHLLAVACFIDDFDCCGNSGSNIGYISNETHNNLVKIDAGEALPFLADSAIDYDPSKRNFVVGTNTSNKNISFENLNALDQREFAIAANKIERLSECMLKEIFAEFIKGHKIFEKVLHTLLDRKKKFLDGFSPEIKNRIELHKKILGNIMEDKAIENWVNEDSDLNYEEKMMSNLLLEKLSIQKFNKFRFQIPERNENHMGRETELDSLTKLLKLKGTATLCGLGGMGKSDLVIEYAYRNMSRYTFIIWLYSENEIIIDQIKNYLIKSEILLNTRDSDNVLLKKFFDQFYDLSLIIFDNAEKPESINKYLPKRKNFHILITSRFANWEPKINLMAFNNKSAHDYIVKKLEKSLKLITEEEIVELNTKLGGLPLALAQATSFIDQNKLKSLKKYLELIESTNIIESNPSGDNSLANISTTFTLALNKIKKMNKDIEPILSFIAYVSSENIKLNFLEKYFNKNISIAIKILLDYSIMSVDQDGFKINKMVQGIIRKVHKQASIYRFNFKKCFDWIYEQLNFSSKDFEVVKDMNDVIHHALSLTQVEKETLKYHDFLNLYLKIGYYQLYMVGNYPLAKDCYEKALKYQQENGLGAHVETAETMINMGNVHGYLGDHEKQIEYLISALEIKVKHFGKNHPEIALIYVNLGNTYGSLGNLKNQVEYLENALVIYRKNYKSDNFEIADNLAGLGVAYGNLGVYEKQKEYLEKALDIYKEFYAFDHPTIGKTMTNLGNALGNLGNYDTQRWYLDEALQIIRKFYGEDHSETAGVLTSLGNAYGDLGNYQTQKDYLEKALVIYEKSYGKDHILTATTFSNLGNVYGELGLFEKQKEYLEESVTILEDKYGADDHQTASVYCSLANTYGKLGNYQTKKEFLEKALLIYEKHYGSDHPQTASIIVNLGNVYGKFGDYKTKKEYLQKSLDIYIKHFGKTHPSTADILLNLANAHGCLGDYEIQKDYLEQSLKINLKFYGDDHPSTATSLSALGNSYGNTGNFKKQKEYLEKALVIYQKHYGEDHAETAATLNNLGSAHGDLGNYEKEKEYLERALRIKEKHYGYDHPETASTMTNLGNAYGDLGDFKNQKEYLEKSLAIKKKHFGSDHAETASTMVSLANCLIELKLYKFAKEYAQMSFEIFNEFYGEENHNTQFAISLLKRLKNF